VSLRLHAVTLVVPDYDLALRYYVDTLGFSLVEDTDLGHGKRWVLIAPGDPKHSCFLIAKAVDNIQSAAIGAQAGGRVGFFLATDDFKGTHAKFLSAGVVFEETPRTEPYGIVAVFRDPFGNRWDLIEFADRTV